MVTYWIPSCTLTFDAALGLSVASEVPHDWIKIKPTTTKSVMVVIINSALFGEDFLDIKEKLR